MHWSIRQHGEQWEVLDAEGTVRASGPTYDDALSWIAAQLAADSTESTSESGLLPETWEDAGGIAFSTETGDGRDFSQVAWSWREPSASTLPLMLQTETEMGHFGAQLAGYFEAISEAAGAVHASGRFYDSEHGRQLRDMLLDGRTFGVSVDPGRVEAEWECIEEDSDGWCMEEKITFTAYEVVGVTATPFPAFVNAAIQISSGVPAPEEGDAPAVAASATPSTLAIPVEPPAAWFAMAEPDPADDPLSLLVEQPGGGLAVPLTILDDGQVFGHVARWEQCHTGFAGQCRTAPASQTAYAHFHVGETICADGSRVASGSLIVGCDHASTASTISASTARDHYANAGLGWADVRVANGALGAWACGTLRPGVTSEQVAVLRRLSMSGDWRPLGNGLELVAVLAVNVPGFPIAREALAASGIAQTPTVRAHGSVADGRALALVAAGVVQRCVECAKRSADSSLLTVGPDPQMEKILATLATLERRTRHLLPAAQAHAAQRLGLPATVPPTFDFTNGKVR